MRALTRPWLGLAAIALSLTLHLSDGFFHQPTLWWLGASLVLAMLGVAGVPWPFRARSDVDGTGTTRVILTLGAIVSAVAMLSKPLARYLRDPEPLAHPDLVAVVTTMAAAAVVAWIWRNGLARRVAVVVILAGGIWLGAWTVRESPEPHIDVMGVHEDAFRAVARGHSPYGITFADIYGIDEGFYSPEMRDGKRVLFGFPYPPLSLLLAWPGHALFGDLRYSEVAALVAAAAVLVWIGGSLGTACAAVLLLAPRLVLQLEQGWTEPFPILLLTLTVATALRRPTLTWLPLGLLIASKQHMVLALVFVPMLATRSSLAGAGVLQALRAPAVLALKAVAVAGVVTLPLALLDIDAFVRSAVLLQLREPFRLDSLSFTRQLVALGWPLDKEGALLVSLSAGAIGIGLSWWRAPRTPAGFAAALGLTCFLLSAFGKKAFLNYYFMVVAFLLTAVAASRPERPAPRTQPD